MAFKWPVTRPAIFESEIEKNEETKKIKGEFSSPFYIQMQGTAICSTVFRIRYPIVQAASSLSFGTL